MRRRPAARESTVEYLAADACTVCGGRGRRKRDLCGCVLRRAFRVTLARLKSHAADPHPHYKVFSRRAEYAADVWLAARRVLNGAELVVLREFWMLDRGWREVERKTRLGRGQFFHAAYRVEEKLGRELLDTEMFPPERYFAGLPPECLVSPHFPGTRGRRIAPKPTDAH